MEHDGHRERLRKRFRQEGLEGFAPHEVLELLLMYAIPRIDTNPLAHQLLDHFGSLHRVMEASPEELEQVPSIGPRAASLIALLLPVMKRYEQEKVLPRQKLDTYSQLTAYCRTLFLGVGTEQLYLLSLDAKMKLLAVTRISSGTPAEVSVNARLILQELIRRNAVGAVITHNHPSGSCQPSAEDLEMTMEIQQVLGSVGIRLYDHVIIGGNEDYSMFANRLIMGMEDADMPMAADRPQRKLQAKNGKKQ